MSKQTFAERCQIAEQCLPDAPYRAMLTKLHTEMLAALTSEAKEQPAQQEPVATLYGSLPVYDKPAQQDLPDLIAGALGVSRGTAYDMMREALADAQPEVCCGSYTNCLKPCTPRGEWMASQQQKPLTDEQIDDEFDAFASKFDHESNEWLDMGVDAYFRAGFKAATGITKGTP